MRPVGAQLKHDPSLIVSSFGNILLRLATKLLSKIVSNITRFHWLLINQRSWSWLPPKWDVWPATYLAAKYLLCGITRYLAADPGNKNVQWPKKCVTSNVNGYRTPKPFEEFRWKNYQTSRMWSCLSVFFFIALRFFLRAQRGQTLTWGLVGKRGMSH